MSKFNNTATENYSEATNHHYNGKTTKNIVKKGRGVNLYVIYWLVI
jgi:hypothetical protein